MEESRENEILFVLQFPGLASRGRQTPGVQGEAAGRRERNVASPGPESHLEGGRVCACARFLNFVI